MGIDKIQKASKMVFSDHRYGEGVVQADIIDVILNASGGIVTERDVREKLKRDQKTIRYHMQSLHGSKCVDWIHPDPNDQKRKKTWGIRRIENLRNIRNELPKIELKKYNTAVEIVIKTLITGKYPYENDRFREQLHMSESFFDLCVLNDPETLFQNAWKIFQLSEGFERYRHMKNCIDKLISDYAKYHPNTEMTKEVLLKNFRETPTEEFEEIFKETIDKVGYINVFEALTYELFGCVTNLDNVFENCVLYDISSGKATPEEVELIYRKKDEQAKLREELERDPVSTVERIIQDNHLSGPEFTITSKLLMQKWKEAQQKILNLYQLTHHS